MGLDGASKFKAVTEWDSCTQENKASQGMNTSAPPMTDRHFGFLEWGEQARIPAHIQRRPEHRQSRVWGAIRYLRLDGLTFPFTRETLATVNPSPRETRTHVQEDMPET